VSLWNNFLDNIAKPVGRGLAEGASSWANWFTGNIGSPASAVGNIVLPAAVDIGVSKQLAVAGLEQSAQEAIKDNLKYSVKGQSASNDLVLKAGVALHDEVISPYITRPVSTLALMTDFDSPLYIANEFEKGFQVSDFKRAYNRSEKISLGQALTKSDLTPIKDVANVVFKAGNIDLDNIDLYNDNDVQAAFVDNTVGKYFTGGVDLVVSNVAIGGVFGAVTKGGKFTARQTGLSSRGTTVARLEKDINDGIAFETGLTGGKQTVSGDLIVKLANSKDANYITLTVGKFSNNENLLGPILKANNPDTVKDLILADKGYLPALDRLSKNAPADLYEIGDVNSIIRNRVIETGRLPEFNETAWSRMNAAFDDAINRVPEYRQIKDALLDPQTGVPLKMGKDYFPIEPKFSLGTKAAVSVGTIRQRIIGDSLNGPLTRVVNFSGSQLPLGHVTFSGIRPLDGVKELNAVFDSIDALRYTKTAGLFGKTQINQVEIKPDVFISVADFRNKVISDFVSAKDDISRVNVLNALDDQLGIIIAAKYKYYDVAKINEFTQTIKNHIFGATDSLARRGYGMDAQSMRVLVDPQTQRQLVESYRIAPWNIIENEIKKSTLIKGPGKKTQKMTVESAEIAQRVFEISNKYWSIDVLARPNYIPKNSLFEPSLSAIMAHGVAIVLDGVPSMTKNFIKNNKNRLFGQVSKKYNSKEISAINKTVEGLTDELDKAVTNLNNLTAELDTFLGIGSIKPSPKAIRDNQAKVVNELKAANKLVDDIELELRDATRPFGKLTAQVPTIANLERRIKFLENEVDTKGKYSGEIFAAKAAITKSKGAIATLAPNSKEIISANKEIALQYNKIENILEGLGEQKYNQALVYEKGSKYKERFYGKDKNYIFVNSEYVPVDSLFNPNQFGLAMKQEFGNARTASATYLGELSTGIRQGMITRRGSSTVTYVNDPIYFEELAYFTNRSLRGDKLIDQILADVSEKELIEWGNKNIGYFEQFGPVSKADIPNIVADKVALVNRFLPDKEARLAALAGEVNSVQLQKILSRDLKSLSPIHPLDFDVHNASEFGVKNIGWIEKQLDKAASTIFSKLTAPENPIRWASGNKFFVQNLQRKTKELEAQGFSFVKKDGTVDLDKINVLRSAASREALQQNEKVFYTIRRQSKPLYAARLATAFPTASLNAFYRYGKFALSNPERVSQFLYNYQSAFRSFGVDKYGAPTDDPLLATHLIVPSTKEMGFFGGKGIRLNARSIGFLLNYPTPSIFSSFGISKIYGGMPGAEDVLKNYLGSYYDVVFPFGPQPSLGQAFTPRWANDAINYLVGPEGKRDFLDSWIDVHNYYMTLDELKIQKYPGFEEIKKITREQFAIKANWSFANIFGVPAKVDTNPMSIYDDLYGMLVNKYRQSGIDEKEAKKLAGTELNERLGVKFPLDRITFKGSSPEAYIQPNVESYNRVFKENTDLAVALAKVDPELIGLLSLDIDTKDNFNLTVYNILRDPKTKLPDGSPLNSYMITPEEQERRRLVNRAWNGYYFLVDGLEKKAQDLDNKSLRSHPELKAVLKDVANNEIRKMSESWWVEWNKGGAEDKAFKYAYGLNQIVSNKEFMEKYGNTKLWSDVKEFTSIRNVYSTYYKNLPERDSRKSETLDAYIETLELRSEAWHPKLKELLIRNFSEDNLKDVR
jgi:hypothetical protein